MKTELRKTRVAYLITRIDRKGPGYIVVNLIKGLDRSLYDPVLVTIFNEDDEEIVEELRNEGYKVKQLHLKSKKIFLLSDYKKLDKWLNKHFDIVHSHGFTVDLANSRMKGQFIRISTVHNIMINDYTYQYGKVLGRIITEVHMGALKKFDKVVACSNASYQSIRKIKNAVYVRNGINKKENTESFSRSILNIPSNAHVLIYVGVMSSLKNVVTLVQLFKRYSDTTMYLIMVGDGPDLEKCKKDANERTIFTGNQDNPLKYMSISDVYVSASNSEGFSVAVMEALSSGLKLLLSDIGSHREVIELGDEVNIGQLFSESDFPDKLSEVVCSSTTREQIKKFYQDNLTSDKMVRGYQSIYQKSLNA